ncbi:MULTISPECIES: class I SAM-dependent methyltransferase [unclassified Pantoea]|uniref:class I SAM-dependent methyltransferase n=1 Tax=unclassified Pantoea TaxID=2630326 RepID=UPI001CD3D141|nr:MULTISPECIES: class I SAM-dependent methyltransferase [unclassified Pantoea]MCA1176225.1 class I SAM-dependent methyltransferase [Pantoea sp. alder69]MCA1249195.1 class I SAM-dependent methyltransferase [Pantoea sp. alder70]MCA1264730.1 class I SAM-dependent methyltransferase [Pantoea sp. alder81]
MSNNFYRAFEDKHRGSVADIRQRLTVYLPLVTKLNSYFPDDGVIDIGCGRGEWLKLLRDNNIRAVGVDLDEGMLAEALKDGLTVELDDCINFLKKKKNESAIAITGFHLVEHLPFEIVHTLVSEAQRVLKPGGLLILETPNPENLSVGSCSFYMDPTHQNPIPPELLKFLPDYYGFERTRIVRLQESARIKDNSSELTLSEVLKGVSPDYSTVSQKSGSHELITEFNEFFVKKIGVTLDELADRYDMVLADRYEMVLGERLEVISLEHEKKIESVRAEIKDIIEFNKQLENRLAAVYSSNSWRITAPLRRVIDLGKRTNIARKKGLKYLAKAIVRKIFQRLVLISGKYPKARTSALSLMRKLGLYSLVKSFYFKSISEENLSHNYNNSFSISHVDNLTNRAKGIYEDLHKDEVKNHKGNK